MLQKTQKVRVGDWLTEITIQSLRREIQHYVGLADRVIN
jgi:hypothetical protein